MSQGERCPGCLQGRLISRALGFRECTNVECYYTTAGQPEHGPEPSPEPDRYALTMGPWAVLPMPADTDTPEWRREYLGEWSEPSPEPETTVERDGMGEYRISTVEKWCLPPKSYPGGWAVLPMPADTPTKYMRPSPIPPRPTAEDQAAIDQRNLDIAEGRTKPEQACSDCGGELVRRRIRGTEMSVPFCEQCECPTKPERTCPQCGEGVDWNAGLLQCDACGFVAISADPDKGAAIEKLNRELAACDEMDRVMPGLVSGLHPAQRAFVLDDKPGRIRGRRYDAVIIDEAAPNPEAEVTEVERLRCLVKALEHEAQGLRRETSWLRSRYDRWTARAGKLSEDLTASRSAHLSTRLKLVTALADLQSLRESYAECVEAESESPQLLRSASDRYGGSKSRLGDVPGFVFERGPRITCSEED